ncbi:MAG: hypothetical protein IPG22_00110 [Acidobacteria bacterium]|nr:hypothetical protein [Acidobacteriota bacterium]
MDVDVVVRRALVYAMTTVAIAMMIGAVALGLVFLAVGNNLSTTEITLRALIAIVAMGAIVLLSEPLKKFLQERADRFFYGERYDLRRSLLDFGRTLSATTALDPLLDAGSLSGCGRFWMCKRSRSLSRMTSHLKKIIAWRNRWV